MKKVFKRIAAMSAAVVTAVSMTMNAGAIDRYNYYEFSDSVSGSGKVTSRGSVSGTSTVTVEASTGLSTASGGASVAISIYYKKSDGSTGNTGTGAGGQSGASARKSITKNDGTYKYSINNHVGYNKTVRNVTLYKK